MAETELRLILLGDLEVIRDGETLPLPPSRKTRALLAYLAMNPRPFRREHLCELLWEIPDDPRGALRWSLSKIRGLVDSASCRHIIADRTQVRFDATGVRIDARELCALADGDLGEVATADLEQAARSCGGNFLEGLELTNFHGFYAWCIAERERITRARSSILTALVSRLAGDPERALPFARALALTATYDEEARATLIRLLVQTGRNDEAEQQYLLGKRLLAEVGVTACDQLFRAWRGSPGSPPGANQAPPQPPQPPRQARTLPSEPRGPVALTGREAEIGKLTEALAKVGDSSTAGVVLLSGAPGIGKSRLLEAVAELAAVRGALVLQATAFEAELLRPFALWLEALGRQSPESARRILSGANPENRERLLNNLADHLADSARHQPLVVILDDFQWADESSALALNHLVAACRQLPLLAVIAARESELNDNTPVATTLRGLRSGGLLQELQLGPLAEAAVLEIIADRAPDADLQTLSRACGGNPLLAIELARAVAAGGDCSSLDTMVRQRLAHLDVRTAEVLRWGAVLAKRIDIATLATLTGLSGDAVGQVLQRGEEQALLMPAACGYRFCHDLVARSIYNEIPPARLRIMHRRVAELLEQASALDLDHAADLAHHACLSGDAALAARALVAAGRLCLRFFANRDAQSLARRGLQLTAQLPPRERICLTLDFHDILLTAAPLDDWQAAAREYKALAEQALDHGAIGHARLGYYMASYVRWCHGHWSGAREETLQAERVTRGGSPGDHVIGMAETAKCLAMLEQDLTRAEALVMEAQALAARQNLRVEAIPTAAGMLRYHENQLAEAEEHFQEARALAKGNGDRINEFIAHEYLVMIAFEGGDHPQALARSAELVALGHKLRDGSEAPFANAIAGLCQYAVADDGAALDSALDDLRHADAKHRLAYVLTRAALLDIERSRPASAVARASEALHCAQVLDRATEILLAHLALALAHHQLGNEQEYQRHRQGIDALADAPVAAWAR